MAFRTRWLLDFGVMAASVAICAVMLTHFSLVPDIAHESVGQIDHADPGCGSGDADGTDEELHLRF